MRCAWQEYLNLVPHRIRTSVDKLGRRHLQELRLRIGQPPLLITDHELTHLEGVVTSEDISFVVNAASQYSPWAAGTIRRGYITAPGGHRIGICGDAIYQNGNISGIRTPTSLCLRVARDFPNIAAEAGKFAGSVLIIGPPCSGKSTLLRDLIRQRSTTQKGSIAVLDERGELFPVINGKFCYDIGINTDILTGCSKKQGLDMLLRTMGPSTIAVDEITEEDDCHALFQAGWSGVSLFATAHANKKNDLYHRPIYRQLIANHLFDTLIVLCPDKTWKAERLVYDT